jgi:hypothetical protein
MISVKWCHNTIANSANKGSMFDSGIMPEDMPLYIQGKTLLNE